MDKLAKSTSLWSLRSLNGWYDSTSATIARISAKYPVLPYVFVRRLSPNAIIDRSVAFAPSIRPGLDRNVLISIPSRTLAFSAPSITRARTYTSTARNCCSKVARPNCTGEGKKTFIVATAITTGIVSSPASPRARIRGMRANKTPLIIADMAATANDTYGGARTSAVITTTGASVRWPAGSRLTRSQATGKAKAKSKMSRLATPARAAAPIAYTNTAPPTSDRANEKYLLPICPVPGVPNHRLPFPRLADGFALRMKRKKSIDNLGIERLTRLPSYGLHRLARRKPARIGNTTRGHRLKGFSHCDNSCTNRNLSPF